MTKIFAIRNDGFEFLTLDLDPMDILHRVPDEVDVTTQDIIQFSYKNTSMASWWKTPETRFIANDGVSEAKAPDISLFGSGPALVLSPKAKRLLGDTLSEYGEFLPVLDVDSQDTYFIFNCLTCTEVDEDASTYEYMGDIPITLESLVFPESTASLTIFKSPFEGCTTLYGNQFLKNAVTDFGLTGVVFEKDLINQG